MLNKQLVLLSLFKKRKHTQRERIAIHNPYAKNEKEDNLKYILRNTYELEVAGLIKSEL